MYKELNENVKVGKTYKNDNGKDYVCLETKSNYGLFQKITGYTEYIVAWNPKLFEKTEDGKTEVVLSWGQGHYFSSIEAATNYFKTMVNVADRWREGTCEYPGRSV